VPLLEVKHLSKSFKASTGWFNRSAALLVNHDISLILEQGQTLAIVGESGSGKSTLARQIIGIEKPTQGSILLNGKELDYHNKHDRMERFKNIRMIFQDPFESLNPNVRIGHSLEQTLLINTNLNHRQRQRKIAETLQNVGLIEEHQYHYPHMFSGGQRQRIAIARAIILEPSIIIADEPLSALDVSVQAQIINLLQSLQEEMGISYIFISHDLNVVEHIADTILVMYRGEVVEYGNVSQIFDEALHPYTQALFASTPIYKGEFPQYKTQCIEQPIQNQLSACVFASRCPYCAPKCLTHNPQLVATDEDYKIACFRFD